MVQSAPDARLCGLLDVPSCGQEEPGSNAKFIETFGLLPLEGGGIVKVALPMFETIAVRGLSVESEVPTVVDVGYTSCDWLRSILRMRLLLRSET